MMDYAQQSALAMGRLVEIKARVVEFLESMDVGKSDRERIYELYNMYYQYSNEQALFRSGMNDPSPGTLSRVVYADEMFKLISWWLDDWKKYNNI